MKNLVLYLTFIFAIVLLFGFTYSINEGGDDGKKLFVDKKCASCHTVETAGIESKKKDASDLSEVGAERSAEFLLKYLKKEAKLEGKEHKPAFKGTDEELNIIVDWLETLKGDTKKSEKKK